ncbi:MAG: mechanosensitive ion channel family protein [Candidatus Pacebacteria bacterium]|nr:mechanosensitive ion channel family protein [Candidatus Paceibacterota bacterium]
MTRTHITATVMFLLALALLTALPVARAQFPGMSPGEPRRANESAETENLTADAVPSNQVSVTPAAEPTETAPTTLFGSYWHRFMGPESPYRGLVLTVITLLFLLNLKAYLTRIMRRKLKEQAFIEENATSFLKVWNVLWKFVIAILVIIALSGSLRLLGLTAGFLGMMLGWSLQQPVTGIAAWLMIILKKPFRIGDRVIIAGITGDVTGISLTHVVLNQVGGSIGGEERSGRGILIPNAILFQNVIINYTLEQKFMLDEVPVRLTFDSDWELAKRLMIEAAKEATPEIITDTQQEPFLRAEFLDWGILVRLRFNTIPVQRQEISTRVIELLLERFRQHYPRVRFAIPSSNVRYKHENGDRPDDFPAIQNISPQQ